MSLLTKPANCWWSGSPPTSASSRDYSPPSSSTIVSSKTHPSPSTGSRSISLTSAGWRGDGGDGGEAAHPTVRCRRARCCREQLVRSPIMRRCYLRSSRLSSRKGMMAAERASSREVMVLSSCIRIGGDARGRGLGHRGRRLGWRQGRRKGHRPGGLWCCWAASGLVETKVARIQG